MEDDTKSELQGLQGFQFICCSILHISTVLLLLLMLTAPTYMPYIKNQRIPYLAGVAPQF